jgi:hypothetical protein
MDRRSLYEDAISDQGHDSSPQRHGEADRGASDGIGWQDTDSEGLLDGWQDAASNDDEDITEGTSGNDTRERHQLARSRTLILTSPPISWPRSIWPCAYFGHTLCYKDL